MTIYDIAKLAGVSKSTVSRVLNNDENVKKATRDKVLRIIEETNFKRNNSAILIKQAIKKKILVLMTRLDSYSENRSLRGIIDNAIDVEFVIYETEFSIDKTKEIVSSIKGIDGIIIFAIAGQNYNFINTITSNVVLIGQKLEKFKCVYFSDYEGMYELLSEVNPSNKSILYLGIDKSDYTTGYLRTSAVKDYCNNFNCHVKIVTVTTDSSYTYNLVANIDLNEYSHVFCASDKIALGVYKAILKQQSNTKIYGFGNNQSLNFIFDHFMSVNLKYKEAGVKAWELLFSNDITHVKIGYNIVEW